MASKTDGPTTLYRHFNEAGELLYVGVTCNFISRGATHRAASWARDVHKITLERFSKRSEALAAEAEAIRFEGPKHNRSKPNGVAIHATGALRAIRRPVTRLKLLSAMGSNRNIAEALGISVQAVTKWALTEAIPRDREDQLRKLRPELFA
jgi:predicted GIY-YIG superfamily endonuclease